MCDFCDARLYGYGSAVKHETYSRTVRLRMSHAGRGEWELHVLASDGEAEACFPVRFCPMCGRALKGEK